MSPLKGSRKKSPFFGISSSISEKADISNIWAYAKDGPKRYRKHVNPAKMRK